ncbi:phage minor head protein [Flavobacterium sp. ARAG 55.4]|uniref:phage minor head protein n=1 Tax=Flavobacterium sp. ARAG 55.4 TaxID=3451357 RepID=UPI003F45376A
MAASLKNDIAQFSAFKETSFRSQLEAALTEDDKVVPWSEFKNKAAALNVDYNQRWLKTEYHHTVATANSVEKWKGFEADADLYPNLKYNAVNDARTREKHRALDGLILPINHPFWKTHNVPLDWGCRCSLEQTDEEPSTVIPKLDIKGAFQNNAALSGKVFGEMPYENGLSKTEKKNAKKLSEQFIADDRYKKDVELLQQDDRWRKAYEDVKATNLVSKHPNMSLEELTTIQHYTNMGYWDLNEALYTKRVFPLEEANERMLNRALSKLPKTDKTKVFRGMPFNEEIYKKYADNVGKTIINEGFTSTTLNEEIAKAFGQDEPTMLFLIDHKNGKELKDISFFSETFENDEEFEVLFQSKTKFKVKEIVSKGDTFEIYLEEVD